MSFTVHASNNRNPERLPQKLTVGNRQQAAACAAGFTAVGFQLVIIKPVRVSSIVVATSFDVIK